MDVLLRNVASVALRNDFAMSVEPLLQFPREPSLHVLRHDVRSQSPDHIKPLKFRGEQPAIETGRRRSEEHTSELQSHSDLVCRLLLEKKKYRKSNPQHHHAPHP